MSHLFSPLVIRDLTLRNRTVVAPMCQYSARHGYANDWHLVHLGRFAIGGFGLVLLEATAVTPQGRISYADLGLWEDGQIAPLKQIVEFFHAHGAAAGIQLAHAGRKAATPVSWRNGFDETEDERRTLGELTWQPVAPSAIPHSTTQPYFLLPHALTREEIADTVEAFVAAARRADAAGFDVVELHAAHGYLINQFLSPLANHRTDEYGGSRANRMRFALEIAAAVRQVWPAHKPLFMRISATDGVAGGWTLEDSIALTQHLTPLGVDLIDCSSGGFEGQQIKAAPLYQVPLAHAVRAAGTLTIAVGLITEPADAEAIVARGDADLVALARGALDDPNWPLHAHLALDGEAGYALWPAQAGQRVNSMNKALRARAS